MYSPTKKQFLLMLGFGGISVFAFVGFVYVVFSSIKKIDSAIIANREFVANSEYALKIKKEMSLIEDDKNTLESFFVQPGGEAYFLESLENEAKKLGLKVSTESVIDGKPRGNGFLPLQVMVRYEGSATAATTFLKKIESLPYAVKMEGVNMSLSTEQNIWSGSVAVSVLKVASGGEEVQTEQQTEQ